MNRPPLLTSLLHPLNLAMLVMTAAAGLCSAWWLAPFGLLFWVIMVVVIARDPGLLMTFTRQSREPLAQRFQTRFDRLDKARFSIFNSLQGVSPSFRRSIEPVELLLNDLVEHAYQLSLRMTALDNHYSVQLMANNFTDDIAKMQKNLANTTDPSSRREYEATLKSLETRQAQLKNVNTLLERFEAQLTGTNNAVGSVVTGVISLKGRSPKTVEEKIPSLLKALQTEQSEFQQFEAELENSPIE